MFTEWWIQVAGEWDGDSFRWSVHHGGGSRERLADGHWRHTALPCRWDAVRDQLPDGQMLSGLARAVRRAAAATPGLQVRVECLSRRYRVDGAESPWMPQTFVEVQRGGLRLTIGDAGLTPRLLAEVESALSEPAPVPGAGAPPERDPWVLLDPEAAGILTVLGVGYMMEADRVASGPDLPFSPAGAWVAAPCLDVWDDPSAAGARIRMGLDEEGTPARPVRLLAEGRVDGYLTDTTTATQLGVPNCGRSRSDGFASVPHPRATNVYAAPGRQTREALLRFMGQGIYLAGVVHAAMDVASGVLHLQPRRCRAVRGGEPAEDLPPRAMRIQVPRFLQRVAAVADDLTFFVRRMGKGRPLQMTPVGYGAPHVLVCPEGI